MLNIFKLDHVPLRRKIKWCWQRITRGFCDYDAYDLDTYYAELIRDSLRHFADKTHSYPGREPFEEYEKWTAHVRQIANEFDTYLNSDANKYEDAIQFSTADRIDLDEIYKNKMWECYKFEEQRLADVRHEAIKNGLRQLEENWENLWD